MQANKKDNVSIGGVWQKIVFYTVITLLLTGYFAFWFMLSHSVKKAFVSDKISYKSFRIGGFPFMIKIKIEDLLFKSGKGSIFIDKVMVKNLLLARQFDIKIGKLEYSDGANTKTFNFSEEQVLQFEMSKNGIKNIAAEIEEVVLAYDEEEETVSLKDISFNYLATKQEDDIKHSIFLRIPEIIKTSSKKPLENNLELDVAVFRNSGVFNSFSVQKLSYNDLTNNFGVNINGDFNYNRKTRLTSGVNTLKVKFINYFNFINAVNRENLLFDVDKSINFVQYLEAVPRNKNDNRAERNFNITTDGSKKIRINDMLLEALLLELIRQS